jgi:RNA polymerase sigma-70 factor (ECF subfamily)
VELSDEVLCQRVAEHDGGAFTELVEHTSAALTASRGRSSATPTRRRISRRKRFLRLLEKAASFDGRSRFTTWFHRLLVNLCLDRRRQRRGWLARLFGSEKGEVAADPIADTRAERGSGRRDRSQADDRRGLEAAEKLSAQQRAALVLHVEEDLSTADIVTVLGASRAHPRAVPSLRVAARRRARARAPELGAPASDDA